MVMTFKHGVSESQQQHQQHDYIHGHPHTDNTNNLYDSGHSKSSNTVDIYDQMMAELAGEQQQSQPQQQQLPPPIYYDSSRDSAEGTFYENEEVCALLCPAGVNPFALIFVVAITSTSQADNSFVSPTTTEKCSK